MKTAIWVLSVACIVLSAMTIYTEVRFHEVNRRVKILEGAVIQLNHDTDEMNRKTLEMFNVIQKYLDKLATR